MTGIVTNLKSILTSLATIFSGLFRKVGYMKSSLVETLRTIIVFGCSTIVALAIFIYAVVMAITIPTSNEELA